MLRNTLRKIPLSAALGVALVASGLAACVPTVDQRGNLPEPDKLAGIRPGATTKDEVAKILGTPSSTAVFDNKTWYYISRRT
jgi:outer membrane protein assembly factor BamE (lipoprotein component of BamABCDE complex)